MKKTSIIILTYNHLDYTKDCIESIRKYTEENTYEIIIIDNHSTDDTKKWLKEQKDLKVIYNEENLGFPKGCNQGIKIANKDNDILLLNNDTIVTSNWLKNLKICLESDSKIGAVGAVCNQYENNQGVDFNYQDMTEMQILAKKNNHSDPTKWEEKAFLIGFCLLIKREVILKLENLDEEYSPGYIEDNDLSLRIIELGYKLMLCHDCFIHHYLGTSFRKDLSKFYPILYKNRDYFYQKWHFNTFAFDDIKSSSLVLFNLSDSVLEINCGIGITMLHLKYKYKDINVEGVEENIFKRKIARKFAKVYDKLSIINKKYNCILLGNLLETTNNINESLKTLKNLLKENGCIIGEIHNPFCIQNINKMLQGSFNKIIQNQRNWLSFYELDELLKNNGFKNISYYFWHDNLLDEEKELLEILNTKNIYLSYVSCTFCARI